MMFNCYPFSFLKSLITIIAFFILPHAISGQVISSFNWNSNPVTNAATGPNATSAGATATSSPGGVGGTNGLNPGAPTAANINLTVPNTGNIFDVPNIDIRIDYRRNESTASMVRRATTFNMNTGNNAANFQVTYRVTNGTVVTTVTSTIYPIPLDNTFRTYRFTYNNCTGVGTMYVNTATVWTSPSPTPNQNLYWVGEGNLIIGQDMDGANNNVPNLDNFLLQNFTCTILPVELASYTGRQEGRSNTFRWSTYSEYNSDHFILERSNNATDWTTVERVRAAGTTRQKTDYSCEDPSPPPGINYYRLMQVDIDGRSESYNIIAIDNTSVSDIKLVSVLDIHGKPAHESDEGIKILRFSDGSVRKIYRKPGDQ